MEDVEKERFQKLRVLAHPLEVETLKPRKRDCIFGVVEQKSELAASGPFREAAQKIMAEGVRQHAQRAKRGVDRVQILDLMIEIALDGGVEFTGPRSLNQDLQKQREKVEIFLCRRERKRVDLEILRFEANAD